MYMNKFVFLLSCCAITFGAFAQQNTYETIKIKAVESLRSGDFASAKSRLNLMEPHIDDSNRSEYQSLLNELQDSIDNSYNKASALRDKKQYEQAIIEYQRLIGRGKEPLVMPLYAHIGYCYEKRFDKELARSFYQLGKQFNEELSIYRMSMLESEKTSPIKQEAEKSGDVIIEENFTLDDFIDIFTPEDQTFGVEYSYSQHFPLGLSVNYTYSCLSVATEFGFNLDGKKYTTNEYNPIGYLVVSPGFYCRFLSINCGVGIVASSYMKTKTWGDYSEEFGGESEDGSISVGGSVNITTSGSTSTSAAKCNFILKPSFIGYIPICDEDYYITINVGYNYIPKFKELNGWSFGVGFQWVI